jgi:hypothetical protein
MSLPAWKAQVNPPSRIFLEIIQLKMKHARREEMSAPYHPHLPFTDGHPGLDDLTVFALY